MADWDANSPRLTENLVGVLRGARAAAFRRDAPSPEDARVWHRDMMAGLPFLALRTWAAFVAKRDSTPIAFAEGG